MKLENLNNAKLMTSSSNVAQTIVPHMNFGHSGNGKSNFMGKHEGAVNAQFKYLNSIHTSTDKIPGLIKSIGYQPIYTSTTSRIPIIR